MVDSLAKLRGAIFSGIYRVDIFHTGHSFDSTEPRPVFTVSPNVFCQMIEERVIYLPLAHNLALMFHQYPEEGFFSPLEINVFSPEPQSLHEQNTSLVDVYKCSYDFIDQNMSTIDMYNVGFSNIIYSSWQLSDVENYLKLQHEHPDTYYLPEQPVRWTVAGEKRCITPEQVARRQQLHATRTFNMLTLLIGEGWEVPDTNDVQQVLSLISLTDIVLANRLDVDERTIRKWRSGQTRMVFTTWCCLCWLAGLEMLLNEPA